MRLHVQFPPEVRLAVHPATLAEGETATLTCHAAANPPPLAYRWEMQAFIWIF